MGLAAGAGLWMVGRAWRRGGSAHPAPAIALFAALGYLALLPWLTPWLPAAHIAHLPEEPMHFRVRVVETLDGPSNRQRLTAAVEAWDAGGGWREARGLVRLALINGEAPLEIGERLEFRGRLRAVRNFDNPGGFDYRRYLALRDIHRTTFVDLTRAQRLGPADAPRFAAGVARLRLRLATEMAAQVADPDAAAVLQALVLGVRGGISADVRRVFQDTGVAHLLAISGLHVSIVALVAMILARALLGRWEGLRHRGWVRPAAALLALGPVLVYGVLAGMAPATQRAMVMAAAGLAAICLGRPGDSVNFLAVAALVLLVLHPPLVASLSFQLSFTAVGAIVLGVRALPHRPHPAPGSLRQSILRALGGFLLVTVLATVGTLPLVLASFNRLSLVSLAGNAVAVPLIGFVAVPLGLMATAIGSLNAWGADLLLQAAAGAVTCALGLLRPLADWPWAAVNTFRPTALEIGLYYAALGVLAFGRQSPRGLLMLVLVLAGIAADGAYWAHRRFWHQDLRITVVDVGQGSAALLELPGGKVMVIDGGGFPGVEAFDVGARILGPLLRLRKILTVDTLILSHANSDHLQGLLHLADGFHVRTLLSNGEWTASETCLAFRDILARRRVAHPPFEDLPPRLHLDGVDLDILNPPPGFRDPASVESWRNLNNNSLAVRVGFGGLSVLLPGDVMAEAENEMVRRWGPALRSDLIVAPHHGSRSSSTARFVEAVAPRAVVVSAGHRNRYGFPHPEVVERYRRHGCHIFRTDRDGAVEIAIQHGGAEIHTRRGRQVRLAPPSAWRWPP